ncbi:MAG: hypothetical protein KGJ57_15365 [Sphingomonadales bacterium]|nr:hypothetical protein [Sphingomonadales bacterium]MDE2170781.1 hypothetical protein [Sphingomonadales bacterium]
MADNGHSGPTIERRDLFERLWSQPMTALGAELGVPAPALATLARQLALPLPGAGHWTKKSFGKEPSKPDYPADPALDGRAHPLPVPQPTQVTAPAPLAGTGEHRNVASTRATILRNHSTGRVSTGGRGKFRLLVTPASGARACRVLDRLVAAVEAKDWTLDSTERGYAIVVDGESIGLMIEEKLDRVPHLVTAAEQKAKAEYDRKCALADRGIGLRPYLAPTIPEHDHEPNGDLALKFDQDYDAGGTRRVFSDGKRQRLEDLVPAMIDSLARWATAVKARRDEREQSKRHWEELEHRRQEREQRARAEGYRIMFLQRQVERVRELEGLSSLIARWEEGGEIDPGFAGLLDFARQYREWLEARIAPTAIAKRIGELKLMDDNVYVYDPKRLE